MSEDDIIDGEDPFDPDAPERSRVVVRRREEDDGHLVQSQLRRRRIAYMRVFRDGGADEDDRRIVLRDINAFCRMDSTPYDADDRTHCLLTGRYEVARRIRDHTDLDFEDLLIRYSTMEK